MANPKGNPQNLVPNSERTPKERKDRARKMGKKSGEVRAFTKNFRDSFRASTTQEEIDAMIAALKQKAMNGDVQAWQCLRDLNGEKPGNNVDATLTGGLVFSWED